MSHIQSSSPATAKTIGVQEKASFIMANCNHLQSIYLQYSECCCIGPDENLQGTFNMSVMVKLKFQKKYANFP